MNHAPNREAFWMVWNPQGHAPTVRHETYDKARTEATRLARANRGQHFYVLQATAHFTTNDVIETTLSEFVEIPF